MTSSSPLYQVADWCRRYENSKSMGYKRPQMACSPNHLSGPAWVNIVGEVDGAAINGIFDWIIKYCSQQECGEYRQAADGGKPYFRSSRDGWLTADGTREGRRLSARELSFMFRRPIEEIHRALFVLISPEVALIKLVDGKAEFGSAPVVADSVTVVSPAKCIEKNRTEKERNALASVSAVTDSEVELIQHAEAKTLIADLAKVAFDRTISDADWRNPEKDYWLDGALPITRKDWQAVDWFYRLPVDHDGLKTTARRQSLESFLEHLRQEIDKAKSLRNRLGLNGYAKRTEVPHIDWPPGGKKAATALYGPRDDWPEFFDQMTSSVQSEILAQISRSQSEKVA